jgi:hypothetical protein
LEQLERVWKNIHEDLVREMASAIVESGMKAAGYQYIILDDLWQRKPGSFRPHSIPIGRNSPGE